MLVDWFTVGAQALNFIILVGLMKRFLYKPILQAIDAREKRIAAELADADEKESLAKKERTEFEKKNEAFDAQRAALLSKATEEAQTERRRLLDEARKAAEVLTAKRQEKLRRDAQELNQEIGRQTREEVFAIARKALSDLASSSLEERMSEVFTRRLAEMDSQAKARLGAALEASADPAVVRSAFELPAKQRAAIQYALNVAFAAEIRLRFETASLLVGGIELSTNGEKVAWSINDYLGLLEKSVVELVGKPPQPEHEGESAPAPVHAKEAHAQ